MASEGGARKSIKVGVAGASGYIGAELLRYLVGHPQVSIDWATANTHAGKSVADVLPNLVGVLDLELETLEDVESRVPETDVVFTALPHNHSQDVIPRLAAAAPNTVFIDMGGDFRSPDPERYRSFYGRDHAAPDWLERFVYGVTEHRRDALRRTKLVANPGCFATAMGLALAPLARGGRLPADVYVAAITGSSGAGNKPLQTTHHPERAANVRAYKPLVHQHLLEVESFLATFGEREFRLHFVPQGGPYVRGIFATIFTPGLNRDELERIYSDAYADESFVSVVSGSPEVRWIQGSPRAFLGVAGDAGRGVVFAVLDNLGKGAAGQAIQNMNCIFGLPETTGLVVPAGWV